VIEGYPRSANTFSVIAFQQAQESANKKLSIAHHLHVEAQLIKAVKLGIPACALIRQPEKAASSFIIRHPEISPNWAVQRYIQFYTNLQPYLDDIYIAEFNDVTTNFGKVIQGINKQFGTGFLEFTHSDNQQDQVFKSIEGINKQKFSGQETFIARPSELRKKISHSNKINFDSVLIRKANSLYEQYLRNQV